MHDPCVPLLVRRVALTSLYVDDGARPREISRDDLPGLSSRLVAVPDVMGVSEIAVRLGLSKKTVEGIVRAKGFPEGRRLTMGWVWSAKDVEAWIAKYRPPKP